MPGGSRACEALCRASVIVCFCFESVQLVPPTLAAQQAKIGRSRPARKPSSRPRARGSSRSGAMAAVRSIGDGGRPVGTAVTGATVARNPTDGGGGGGGRLPVPAKSARRRPAGTARACAEAAGGQTRSMRGGGWVKLKQTSGASRKGRRSNASDVERRRAACEREIRERYTDHNLMPTSGGRS